MNLEEENQKLKAELAEFKQAKNEKFVNGLISDCKLYPKQKDDVLKLLNFAERIENGETINFSEEENVSGLILNFLENLPQREELKGLFHEVATVEKAVNLDYSQPLEEEISDFLRNAKYGRKTHEELKELHQKIAAYAKQNKLSYSEALDALEQKRKGI